MLPRPRRINKFIGTDTEYIAYLEALILKDDTPLSPPSPRSDAPNDEIHDEVHTSECDEPSTSSLRVVPYTHERSTHLGKRKRAESNKHTQKEPRRWECLMDKIIRDVKARDLKSRREEVGLSSQEGVLAGLDTIIHATLPTNLIPGELGLARSCPVSSNGVLQLLDGFAITTASLRVHESFTTQICLFREFIFISLCQVALHHGANRQLVYSIMRKFASKSSEKNLDRLLKGALWVNQLVGQLAVEGLGYFACEIFVLWGRSAATYGRFADAGEEGLKYFMTQYSKADISIPGAATQPFLPFWVPFIIKTAVENAFSLQMICTALGYNSDSLHDYPRYLDNYRREYEPIGTRAINLQTNAGIQQTGPENGHNRVALLLEAAHQSDLPQSMSNQHNSTDYSSTSTGSHENDRNPPQPAWQQYIPDEDSAPVDVSTVAATQMSAEGPGLQSRYPEHADSTAKAARHLESSDGNQEHEMEQLEGINNTKNGSEIDLAQFLFVQSLHPSYSLDYQTSQNDLAELLHFQQAGIDLASYMYSEATTTHQPLS